MINKIKFLTAIAILSMLSACGGGGGGTPVVDVKPVEVDTISSTTLNPSLAIQNLYTFVGNKTINNIRYQYSTGVAESYNGITYNVQNILQINVDGTTTSSKRLFTLNPFAIYTPDFSYYPKSAFSYVYTINVSRTLGSIPTSAKVGDFGAYETAKIKFCNIIGGLCTEQANEVSSWTLEKETNQLASFCFGSATSTNLTSKNCYKINSQNLIIE